MWFEKAKSSARIATSSSHHVKPVEAGTQSHQHEHSASEERRLQGAVFTFARVHVAAASGAGGLAGVDAEGGGERLGDEGAGALQPRVGVLVVVGGELYAGGEVLPALDLGAALVPVRAQAMLAEL